MTLQAHPRPSHEREPPGDDLRVSSLELFFDLVFVFTITQLTSLLTHDLSAETAARVILIFTVLFWMYGGYAWLTNQVPPIHTGRRLLLILGMGAFLLCALAIPRAFGEGTLAFGVGYLAVTIIHASLYAQAYGPSVAPLAAMNVLSALAITASGLAVGPAVYALWVAAILVQFVAPRIAARAGSFEIRPRHFVERHGLLLLIALGESVVAVGAGVGTVAPTPGVFLAASLGLALAAALWWTYFVVDEAAAERAMVRATPTERFGLAIGAYFFAYVPMLLGIVATAAGVQRTLGRIEARLDGASAVALGAGVAAYLLGNVLFRRTMGMRPLAPRAAGGVAALASATLGATVSALVELLALLAVLAAILLGEAALRSRRLERHSHPR